MNGSPLGSNWQVKGRLRTILIADITFEAEQLDTGFDTQRKTDIAKYHQSN